MEDGKGSGVGKVGGQREEEEGFGGLSAICNGVGCHVRHVGRTRTPPYPPHIWAGYEGCRSARAFEARLRGLSGSKIVTGQPAQSFEEGLGCPDAVKERLD